MFLMGLQGVWEQNALDKRLIKQYGEREKSTHYNAREDSFKMKKAITLMLSLAVLLSLTACSLNFLNRYDGEADEPDGNGSTPPAVQPEEPSVPGEDDVAAVEPEIPDDTPDATPLPDPEEDEKEPDAPEDKTGITASHTDVTLFSEGETFTLSARDVPGIYACTFTSADETVAAVDEKLGTVTAAAPGMTTVTMHLECESGQYDFDCIVRCSWKEEEASTPGETAPGQASVSLNDFYSTLQSSYEGLDSMMVLDGELLDTYYPGLSSIAAVEEVLIQETRMTMANMAVGLVKLSDDAVFDDFVAVTEVLNARIAAQADGGAWYPASCETWGQGVTTSVTRYVGMFVYPESAQDMADLFTETFSN